MADCEFLKTCPFFNAELSTMPGTAALYRRLLCQGDNAECARLMVRGALGPEKVPKDLYPNDVERAQALIAKR